MVMVTLCPMMASNFEVLLLGDHVGLDAKRMAELFANEDAIEDDGILAERRIDGGEDALFVLEP